MSNCCSLHFSPTMCEHPFITQMYRSACRAHTKRRENNKIMETWNTSESTTTSEFNNHFFWWKEQKRRAEIAYFFGMAFGRASERAFCYCIVFLLGNFELSNVPRALSTHTHALHTKWEKNNIKMTMQTAKWKHEILAMPTHTHTTQHCQITANKRGT